MTRILAIDQGTTSTRALLVDAEGRADPLAAFTHHQHYPAPGRVEHDPLELLSHVTACLEAGRAAGAVAWGLDNQGESCLAWDRHTGAPLSPVIVWQDERTAGLCDRLRAEGAEAETLSRAGLPLDPYFSASKLAWILREVPAAARAAAAGNLCLGTTDAFFRHRLTGRYETDPTTASRTSLMNLATREWDETLCTLFGVPRDCLPAIAPTAGDLGGAAGLPLAASVVDQQAALRGHGCVRPGDAKITFGTGAFVLALAGESPPPAGAGPLPTVAWALAGRAPAYALDGGLHAAGAAVNWARALGLAPDLAAISAFDRPPAISRGLAFVPALAGLACPHWDRAAKGAWLGMTLDTGPADLMQALLEGVAFRTAEVVAAMERVQPLAGPVPVDGGMSRNPWFCSFLAGALGREIRISDQAERTALGCALLAAEGLGLGWSFPQTGRLVAPEPQPADWAARFARARALVQDYGRPA